MKYDFDKFFVLMKEHNETYSSLARVCGGRPSTFTDWKAGLYEPKLDKLKKIAWHWKMSTFELVRLISVDDDPAFLETEEKSSTSGKKYYFNDETAEIAEELFRDSNMRALFDAAREAEPKDIQLAAEMLARFKRTNPDG